MIDYNKIEEAAKHYAGENSMSIEDQMGDIYDDIEELSDAYKAGAKWMQEEFLKNLWHRAIEKPNREGKAILFNCIDHNLVPSWCVYPIGFQGNWNIFCGSHGISKWCYIEDILPKGGEK